jgi:hypothetical protein
MMVHLSRVLWFALVVHVCLGHPATRKRFLGLRRLAEPDFVSADGTHYEHQYSYSDEAGREITVSYELDMPGVKHNLDAHAPLSHVTLVQPRILHLTFDADEDAQAFLSKADSEHLLHGHYLDATTGDASLVPHPFHARLLTLSSHVTQSNVVVASIGVPTLTEVFQNARVSVAVKLAPEDYVHVYHHEHEHPSLMSNVVVPVTLAAPVEAPAADGHDEAHDIRRRLGFFSSMRDYVRYTDIASLL